ncbi:MAG: hypothetical protein HQK51_08640 [Oligoflexia bacterium]|nr:hypothetical protein [Oligoflexia bacterium]
MSIYNEIDYRKIFKGLILQRKKKDSTINFQNMATYMRIQKPYLSKIINGFAHMNADHISRMCLFKTI